MRLKRYYSRTLYRSFWFNAGLTAARVLGVRGARRLGRFGGAIYGWTHPQARAAVRANLALVCKAAANNGGVTRTFRNFGATLADYFQIGALSKTNQEQAQSIAGFAQVSAHEATREEKNPKSLKHSILGLESSVHDLEQSHPQLVGVVNRIATMLSNMGI